MLKLLQSCLCLQWQKPAAFRRLCVETLYCHVEPLKTGPAAFRRLCVETDHESEPLKGRVSQPPSGGCVLKRHVAGGGVKNTPPAAFRRLCVETKPNVQPSDLEFSSRLQAAVC